ncbi:MAG: thiamine phosphate synthase [Acidobacteriia bacterium]|nr:thiamine phosphate synthase [Terriglobia bacterium]
MTFSEAARRVSMVRREAGAMLIVNDRADLAMLLEAGLHIGQAGGGGRRLPSEVFAAAVK